MIFSQTIIAGRKKNRHIGPYAMTYLIFVLTIGGSLSCSLTYFKMSFLVAIIHISKKEKIERIKGLLESAQSCYDLSLY